ncbi:complement regulator-acquiring protein (plasmid) [Borrelia coriaceae]|uniref:Antigen P35 n=1 Tax=Borrelia coriaceae ATCC 43381 TaxID=1408429 RepID=W5SVD3_9SPIR|nr:complement regulator-acquiring protein [Borrelia coriaceae]AHH11174.1 Hypothetical protein BCO_0028800 [Borrelia coriaceae ATCC 43381]UPA16955.1 complement regulator-acquiring protein [Borrelia coriaceae]
MLKNYFFITYSIIISTLTNCNADLALFPKGGIKSLRKFLDSIEPQAIKQSKENLINNLQNKAYNIKQILDLHNNNSWIEDSDQFGLKGQNRVFDMMNNHTNNQTISDDINKHVRKKFYLALEYDKTKIRNFAKVLNQIAIAGMHQNNILLTNILNTAITYSMHYFEIVFATLMNKKDQLEALNPTALQYLTNELNKLENIRYFWHQTIDNIINDYIQDKNNIKTDKTKIIPHIKRYYQFKLVSQINKIQDISNNIINILTN